VANPFYFLEPDFWNSPKLVFAFIATVFGIVLLRYLITALLYRHGVLPLLKKRTMPGNKVADRKQLSREIGWSALSSAIFALLAAGCYGAYQKGWTLVYTDVSDYPLWYFFFSIGAVLFLYETYYYWLHRWMHKPGIFRVVHKVHHESIHTSVFTSFSFHPIEALLQFLFIPLVIMVLPIHYTALGIVLLLMTISAVINHAGVEVFPKRFHEHRIGKWLIGATHHDLHHKEFRNNFGLYFTFWDRWMKTESEKFSDSFIRNTTNSERRKDP
jgi:sterol desaturase/sphingolipid hydroxylase (fatty acid hydroxylase superfamily)